MYTKAPEAGYLEAVITVLQIITQPAGSGTFSSSSGQEIESAQETLQHRTRGFGTRITGSSSSILRPSPPISKPKSSSRRRQARKVVLATNIAETSITIDNIVT